MADVMDIDSCYEAMLDAKACLDLGMITMEEYEEDMLAIKQIKKRVLSQLIRARRDTEDGFEARNHRR